MGECETVLSESLFSFT